MSDERMDDEETDAEDVIAPVETPVAEASVPPQTEPEEDKVEVPAEEVVETPAKETPAEPVSISDMVLKEIAANDVLKAALIEKAIAKEAQRLKDEWAGREAGWIEKSKRKEYAKNPAKWQEDQRKLGEYDKLREEIESLRRGTPQAPAKVAETPVAKVVEKTTLDEAKEFVTQNNIDEAQTPLIAALFEKVAAKIGPRTEAKPVDVRSELAKIQWEEEKVAAESDADYQSNEVLQALAWKKAQVDKLSPMKALTAAKAQLGIKPKVVTKVVGPAKKGTPAFARPSGTTPTDGGVKYDGKTDPMKLLKQKYRSEED